MFAERIKKGLGILFGALCFCSWLSAGAQEFPSRTIRIIVPFTTGGTPDLSARLIAERLSAKWKQPVVVENHPGAGTTLGANLAAKAAPDGYTWLVASDGTMVINPLAGTAPYDAFKDFTPVTQIARVPFVLVVNADLPVKNVTELVQYAKAHPGEINFGSSGNGTPQHLAGEMFKQAAGVDIRHIPYRGAVPAIADLLAGRIQMFIGSPNTLVSYINDGRLRALASAGSVRTSSFPDLPTLAESMPNVSMDVWIGLYMPAGVPPKIIDKVNADVAAVLNSPDVKEMLAKQQFLDVAPTTPGQMTTIVRDGQERWGRIIKEGGIQLQ